MFCVTMAFEGYGEFISFHFKARAAICSIWLIKAVHLQNTFVFLSFPSSSSCIFFFLSSPCKPCLINEGIWEAVQLIDCYILTSLDRRNSGDYYNVSCYILCLPEKQQNSSSQSTEGTGFESDKTAVFHLFRAIWLDHAGGTYKPKPAIAQRLKNV